MSPLLTASPPAPTRVPPSSRRAAQELRFEVLGAEQRSTALAAWAELESRRLPDVPVACSMLWTSAWLEHYGRRVPHEFLLARHEGRTAGISLLTRGVRRRNGPFAWRTRHIGTAGEAPGESVCVEYNHVLVEPPFRMAFEEELISLLLHDKSWDAMCFDGFTPLDLTRLLQDIPGAEVRLRDCPYYDLAAARGEQHEIVDRLGRSTRQNARRLLRKYGEVDIEWADSVEQAESILSDLIDLHQARWRAAGQPGAFHSDRFARFQRQLVHDAFTSPLAQRAGRPIVLFRARHRGETVGCLMLLSDRGRLLDYLSGFAAFECKASPGMVTHLLCMTEALRRGYDAYDFLVGEKRHKQNLSTHVHQLAWAAWSRPSLKSRTVEAMRRLKRRLRSVGPGCESID